MGSPVKFVRNPSAYPVDLRLLRLQNFPLGQEPEERHFAPLPPTPVTGGWLSYFDSWENFSLNQPSVQLDAWTTWHLVEELLDKRKMIDYQIIEVMKDVSILRTYADEDFIGQNQQSSPFIGSYYGTNEVPHTRLRSVFSEIWTHRNRVRPDDPYKIWWAIYWPRAGVEPVGPRPNIPTEEVMKFLAPERVQPPVS